MNVIIENYRGFEIIFNKETERFTYSLDEGRDSEKQSLSACRANIDNYLKENIDFKPFKATHQQSGDIINVVGLRKDGDFTVEKNGKKLRLTSWDERHYITFDESQADSFSEIKSLEQQIRAIEEKISAIRNGMKGTSLSQIKKNHI